MDVAEAAPATLGEQNLFSVDVEVSQDFLRNVVEVGFVSLRQVHLAEARALGGPSSRSGTPSKNHGVCGVCALA